MTSISHVCVGNTSWRDISRKLLHPSHMSLHSSKWFTTNTNYWFHSSWLKMHENSNTKSLQFTKERCVTYTLANGNSECADIWIGVYFAKLLHLWHFCCYVFCCHCNTVHTSLVSWIIRMIQIIWYFIYHKGWRESTKKLVIWIYKTFALLQSWINICIPFKYRAWLESKNVTIIMVPSSSCRMCCI